LFAVLLCNIFVCVQCVKNNTLDDGPPSANVDRFSKFNHW